MSEELSPEDWDFFIKVAAQLGLKYYKMTGGEPLLYNGIVDVVRSVRRYGGIPSITTNGYLLKEFAEPLSKAGVDHVNVSLHSLKHDVYVTLMGHDALDRVLAGIREALNRGIKLKINYLVMKPNLSEGLDLINFASSSGIDVNVIELIPLGIGRELYEKLYADLEGIVRYLETASTRKDVEPFQNRVVYFLSTGIKIYVIRGYGNRYLCAGCSRIRIGPDGRIKPCLYVDVYLDLKSLIKSRDENGLKKAITKAIEMREPYFK